MKTTNLSAINGISFGFSTVNAGKRQVKQEPQVIAISTEGGFRITPAISSLLDIQHGEYIMFVNNIDEINRAIIEKHPAIVAFCKENELDIESSEAAAAIHSALDQWGLAKGIKEYDAKGNLKTTSERLSRKDRIKFVNANFDEMLAAAIESASEDVVAILTHEGVTHDEQVEALIPFVQARELPKYRGSKVANPAKLSGVGVTLNFTDSNVWNQLKADLGEEAINLNRVYDLSTEPSVVREMKASNGFEDVTIKYIVLGDYKDVKPSTIVANEAE